MVDNFSNDAGYIYEPVHEFKNVYKDLHHKNTVEYLEKLVETSKVDIAANKETVDSIKKLQIESQAEAAQIRKYSNQKGFLIFLTILSFGGLGYCIYSLVTITFNYIYLLIALACLFMIIVFISVVSKTFNPMIKQLKEAKGQTDAKISNLVSIAWTQMKPLNDLFTFGMSEELFHKTIPLINLDKMFDSKRLDYLVNKFRLTAYNDVNRSTLYVQSGDINGNPFYICKNLVHNLGTKTYQGSITISWTTTRVVNGQTVVDYHTQTLTATVTKPCPYYNEYPYLVYGNEAAPDLSFRREDSDAENLSQKQIDRLVDRDIKKLNRKAEKSTLKGQDYTVMANSEFEVLFKAADRDNEVQFRLLFTPLAQKQLLDLMKEKEIGFGDDFDFIKSKMINYIYPEHLRGFQLSITPQFFYGYDLEAIKDKFIKYNDDYLRYIYFTFAPILAIPLYQQQKPHEYIYKDLYDSYVSFYEHEKVVNLMNISEFKHALSQTRNILKTSLVKSGDFCDSIKVTAHGYQTYARTDYVWVFGGDGRNHQVPVNWTEYIPVEKETEVAINVVQETEEKTYADRFKTMIEDLKNKNISDQNLYKLGTYIAYTLKK